MKISIYIVCCLTLIWLVSCNYRSDAHKGDDDTITVESSCRTIYRQWTQTLILKLIPFN